MATLEQYKKNPATWESVGTQVAISATVSVGCLVLHEVFRRRTDFRHLFSARCYLIKDSSPMPSKRYFGWIETIWNIEETFILHSVGLDAVLYLRFLRMLIQLSGLMMLFIFPILIPINFLGREGKEDAPSVNSIQAFSITNVRDDPKLWAHTILLGLITATTLYLIYKNTTEFVQLRRIHFLKEANEGNPRCRTVMVTNIPDALCDEDKLRNHFDHLGLGEVHHVQLLHYPFKLIEYRNRRKKALSELEIAHTELAKALLKAIESKTIAEEEFVIHGNRLEYHELLRYLKDPKTFSTTPCPQHAQDLLMLKSSQETNTMSVWDLLVRLDYNILAPYHPYHRTEYKTGRRCKSIDYWYNKLAILDRRIYNLRNSTRGGGQLGGVATSITAPTGFITFTNPASAQLCAQSIIHPTINCCQTYLAPEPKDVLWKNHTLSKSFRLTRKLIVKSITWSLIILWLLPVISLLTLVSFEQLSANYPDLAAFGNKNPWAKNIISLLLPAILLAFFMSILPHILYYVANLEAFKTYSSMERTVAIRYYYFCIFNVLFVFLLGPTLLNVLLDSFSNRFEVITTFANRIPEGSIFFINYVIFNLCYQFMELLVLGSPFLISFGSWLFPKTPRERRVFEHSWPFPYYYYIANHLLIYVIVLTYSTVNPMIIIPGFLYFACTYLIFKNQFVYTYVKRYESNGKIWNLIVRFITDGLIFAQFVICCIVALNGQYLAILPIIPTLFATFYFKHYYKKTFRPRLQYVPLGSLKDAEDTPRSSMYMNSPPQSPRASFDIATPREGYSSKLANKPVPNLRIITSSPLSSPPRSPTSPTHPQYQVPVTLRSSSSPSAVISSNVVGTQSDSPKPMMRYPSNHYQQDRPLPPTVAMMLQGAVDQMDHVVERTMEGRNQVYFAQAFAHPALTKPNVNAMTLSMYPNLRHYDLYDEVIAIDKVVSTAQNQTYRSLVDLGARGELIIGDGDGEGSDVENEGDPDGNVLNLEHDFENDPVSSRFSFTNSDLRLTSHNDNDA